MNKGKYITALNHKTKISVILNNYDTSALKSVTKRYWLLITGPVSGGRKFIMTLSLFILAGLYIFHCEFQSYRLCLGRRETEFDLKDLFQYWLFYYSLISRQASLCPRARKASSSGISKPPISSSWLLPSHWNRKDLISRRSNTSNVLMFCRSPAVLNFRGLFIAMPDQSLSYTTFENDN